MVFYGSMNVSNDKQNRLEGSMNYDCVFAHDHIHLYLA